MVWGLYAVALLAWSCFIYAGLLADLDGAVFAENDDPSLFIWWFAHAAAVTSDWLGFGSGTGDGSLLYTHLMNHPDGVNAAWNTSVLGLALPLAPLTWLCGPVVSYNIAIILAAPTSALAAAALIRRFTERGPAFLGGFAYGFSTYVIAQSAGHLNLAFAVTPPLAALCLVQLWRARTWPQSLRTALGLGCLLGWQLYVSSELAAGIAIAGTVFLCVCALALRRQLAGRLRYVIGGGAAAAMTAVLIGLPLLHMMLTGPAAPQLTIRPHGVWNNDVLDLVTPSRYTLIGGAGGDLLPRVMEIDPAEVGGYLGIFWLVFALVTAVALWRSPTVGRIVRITALTGAVMWLLSMGSPWFFAGHILLPIGPYRLIEALPVLGNVLPMRLAVHVTLAAAVLLAVGIDQVRRSARISAPLRAGTAVAAVSAVAAVTTGPVAPRALPIPEFYSAGAVQIPPGSVVKTLPAPIALAKPEADITLVWQAVTGLRYRETGGYFIGSSDTHPVIFAAEPDALDTLLRTPALDSAWQRSTAAEAVDQLRAEGVDFVVVAENAAYLTAPGDQIAAQVAQAAGTSAERTGEVYVIDLRRG